MHLFYRRKTGPVDIQNAQVIEHVGGIHRVLALFERMV
jgi:hypothetical protein